MVDTHLLNNMRWPDPTGKGSTEDLIEFRIQPTDPQFFEIEILKEDILCASPTFALGKMFSG